MRSLRKRAALVTAAASQAYLCESLERRVLLDGEPVIVLTESFNLSTWPNTVNEDTVRPWLWKNTHVGPGGQQEYLWDLADGDWNTADADGNGYADDAYGWNFTPVPNFPNGTPNMIRYGHGPDG